MPPFNRDTRRRLRRQKRDWQAERYGRHPSKHSTQDLYRILTDDAAARRDTPLKWMLAALEVIAGREHSNPEFVFQRIRQDCLARTGRDMPMGG